MLEPQMEPSPFSLISQKDWISSNRSSFAFFDKFPVSRGHTLVVPLRQISTWWDAFEEEQMDLIKLVNTVKEILDERFHPDGYNVGFNAGSDAGQTVNHLHLHVIPRYRGDVADPRGGIRHVIPGLGNYLQAALTSQSESAFNLIDGGGVSGFLQPELERCLADPQYDTVDFVVSFVMRTGLERLTKHIQEALRRGARLRILTSDYLDVTDPDALTSLLDMQESQWGDGSTLEVRIWRGNLSFHPKAYLFSSRHGKRSEGFVGSSNLSKSGISEGVEWNVALQGVESALSAFDHLWGNADTLTQSFITSYRRRREISLSRPQNDAKELAGQEIEPPRESAAPTPIQMEALEALRKTRRDGYRAGLVVMATGLGKTWLSAFDAEGSKKVLFIAHRDEILNQSRDVFRIVHPQASFGFFTGATKDTQSQITFASIQTLRNHYGTFAPDEFDYVIVDEFHHAAASTYRSVIEYFQPSFLLGLTATPERMDGADLLTLCDDNLVYECDLVEGIRRQELVPFHYRGLKDSVDFEPIPWRNGKFDAVALTSAMETQDRAQESLNAWREHGGGRTLGFCCSITHAEYMAQFFSAQGIRAVAVHSGESSAPRVRSIEKLSNGELDVVCAVDLFNEGLDIPMIESVLMLRPTESPVIFLQQLGRGLRTAPGKSVLKVVDFIGNHRSFLSKPRVLLSLGSLPLSNKSLIEAANSGDFGLPEGCSVEIELEAINLLKDLTKKGQRHALTEFCVDFFDEHGVRPSALQAQLAGFDPKKVRPADGSWFGLLRNNGLLSDSEKAIVENYGELLDRFSKEEITKSYKLVALKALIELGTLSESCPVLSVAEQSRGLILRDPRLVDDVQGSEISNVKTVELQAWERYWTKWPLSHLAGGEHPLYELSDGAFRPTFTVDPSMSGGFARLVQELVDWRLADYLLRVERKSQGIVRCRVSNSSGNPIIRFSRTVDSLIPEGWATVIANGEPLRMNFVKIAVNVAERDGEQGNALHSLLRGWFGPDAGLNGTRHFVTLRPGQGGWLLEPETTSTSTREKLVPLFSSYQVACGAFTSPLPAAEQQRSELFEIHDLVIDPERHFVAFAKGDSMNGGIDPIHDGDPLLFEWIRDKRLKDLVGERILVSQSSGDGTSAVLKRLAQDQNEWLLLSDNEGFKPIRGERTMQVTARLIRRLEQTEVNPFQSLIGKAFTREQVARMFGDDNNLFKWRQPGHVSAGDDEVFFVNVSKRGMDTGNEYVDGFLSITEFEWSSMNSTSPDSKKGQAILDVPSNGRKIHLFARKNHKATGYTYFGLLAPMSHKGSKPIQINFRVLTPLTNTLFREFGPEAGQSS